MAGLMISRKIWALAQYKFIYSNSNEILRKITILDDICTGIFLYTPLTIINNFVKH